MSEDVDSEENPGLVNEADSEVDLTNLIFHDSGRVDPYTGEILEKTYSFSPQNPSRQS